VVVKVDDPRVLHRHERGLVRVGLTDEAGVRQAVRDITRVLGTGRVALVVQPVLSSQPQMALGLLQDSALGPLVMLGAAGSARYSRTDRALLVPPFDHVDARRAIRSLRGWPLLDGFRASPRVDETGLERALVRVGRLAVEVPEVAELDLDPVVATAAGVTVVDARLRLAPAVPLESGIPRQLGPA
jgi:acyl-CoA synthetase (NDP forming)